MNTRYGEADTKRMAENMLQEIAIHPSSATVLGLSGDLGAGKTTLTQAIAQTLGVSSDVQSPTFVVMKSYGLTDGPFTKLVHMDAYRIESLSELIPLRFNELLQESGTLIVIEWPERIKEALPDHTRFFALEHDGDHRIIRHA
jgi:tRNA threonylcarbamoyladenosine biosynthesis protein TsaE